MRPKGDYVNGPWNEGSREVLVMLWNRGMPAREIAAVIASLTGKHVSRMSVIGKADRMGLPIHKNSKNHTPTNSNRRAA